MMIRESYPLEVMLRSLAEIADADWYRYAFSRDPINRKFNDAQRRIWMEKSITCGREYAEQIRKEYGCNDPKAMAEAMKMKVFYPELPKNADRVLFAEYRAPDRIYIYMDAVNRAGKYLQRPEIKEILAGKTDVSSVLLAHELFHNVEEKYKKEIYTRTEKIQLWSLGVIHYTSPIIALSEIAAMAFAKELTGISYSPYIMDVLLMYDYSSEDACGLYEEILGYRDLHQ